MIATSMPNLTLRRIKSADAAEFFRLVQDNRAHLTAFGDYADLTSRTQAGLEVELEAVSTGKFAFAIIHDGKILGRADLIPVDPPAAVKALTNYAHIHLGASDIYAGVTHGNVKSMALLERLGFRRIAEFELYARFHLSLSG